MTVSSTNRLASFTGNGALSVYPFTFMVFQPSDLVVVEENTSTGVSTPLVLDTNYSVSLNADQDDYPGGAITLLGGALATGLTLSITSAVPNTQNTDLTNSGGFYPEVITAALDKLTILVQQLALSVAENYATLQAEINALQLSAVSLGYLETISTAGQTVFTAPSYTPGTNLLLVTSGGVLLTNGLDYTETSSTSITLTQAASAGDVYTFRSIS
jgi:hypothetical protein